MAILLWIFVGIIGAWIGGWIALLIYNRLKQALSVQLPEPVSSLTIGAIGAFVGMRFLTWSGHQLVNTLPRILSILGI